MQTQNQIFNFICLLPLTYAFKARSVISIKIYPSKFPHLSKKEYSLIL